MKEVKSKTKLPKRRILKRMLQALGLFIVFLISLEAVRLYQLRSSLTSYKNYWQQQSLAAPLENQVTYVALGDSAAQSIGASSPERGYVGLIATALSKQKERPVHVVNISVSGAKVQDVIDKQLPQLEKLNIDKDTVLTIDIGGNDMRSYEHDHYASQIDYLFSRLPKQTVVSDLPYFGGGRANKSETNAVDAGKIMEAAAKKHGLRIAALHEITKNEDGFLIYAADFFHPSNRGYQNWYKAYWSVFACNDPVIINE